MNTAIESIIEAYGESPGSGNQDLKRDFCLELLNEFPSLLIIDDIDTLDSKAEEAIEFLLMDLPNITRSRVLVTSRRVLFGMRGSTTQVSGLSPVDAEAFIRSRCDLMGIPTNSVLRLKDSILEATDSSPLFIEDLFRLSQAGLDIEKAIGLWSERRGDKARRYAMECEYEKLDRDAQYLLLALSLQGPCTVDDLVKGLNWDLYKFSDVLNQLKLMFLVPSRKQIEDDTRLALNQNTKKLVLDVFDGTDSYRRVKRQMRAARGELSTKRSEERLVSQALRRARLLVNQCRPQEAEQLLRDLLSKYPGRADIHANLAWTHKKQGRATDAREEFKRAHQLKCKDRDAYWHWSKLEAGQEEWTASEEVADFGLRVFPNDQALLFRKGYAVHRLAKERYSEEGTNNEVEKLCRKALSLMEDSLKAANAEQKNNNILSQTYRALVLTAETLGDGPSILRCLKDWNRRCPTDMHYQFEYERLRFKFPDHLPPLQDSIAAPTWSRI